MLQHNASHRGASRRLPTGVVSLVVVHLYEGELAPGEPRVQLGVLFDLVAHNIWHSCSVVEARDGASEAPRSRGRGAAAEGRVSPKGSYRAPLAPTGLMLGESLGNLGYYLAR